MKTRELRTANEHLPQPGRLNAWYDEDGYLFFRDVLDRSAVADLRRDLIGLLIDKGYVEPGSGEPAEPNPLAVVDRLGRRAERVRAPGLHLAEHHRRAVADDEVELSGTAAPVAVDHGVAPPPVVGGGEVLAEPPAGQVRSIGVGS